MDQLIVKCDYYDEKYFYSITQKIALERNTILCYKVDETEKLAFPARPWGYYFVVDFEEGTVIFVEMINQLHRADGPAIIHPDGRKEWFYHGRKTTPQDLFDQLTNEEKEKVIWHLDEWK